MYIDVQDLQRFYDHTRLGRATQKALRNQMRRFWPEAKGQSVIGFGYAVPLLRPYLHQARRVVSLMPGPQGVIAWPREGPNTSVLCSETLWPIDTGHADKLIMMHALEMSGHPSPLLWETYRALGPGGRALIIVPHRLSLWARRDVTPFGYGRPYSLAQLETQLLDHGLVPEHRAAALFQPPTEKRFWRKIGPIVERMGQKISGAFAGGVLMVEVSKKIPAPIRARRAQRLGPLPALDGLTAPQPEPVRHKPSPVHKPLG